MNTEQMVVTLISVVATAIVLIVGIVMYFGELNDERMERLLDKGHSPIEVACMMNPGSTNWKIHCYELARQRADNEDL